MTQTVDRSDLAAPVVPDVVPRWLGQGRPEGRDAHWEVILWNDDHNTVDHVITALLKTIDEIGDLQSAARITMVAHHHGTAIAARCHQEKAELYRERLESFGLTATIRKDA